MFEYANGKNLASQMISDANEISAERLGVPLCECRLGARYRVQRLTYPRNSLEPV
jgi:hypothetical protein